MTDRVLTEKRRSELAELLEDEQRLNAEYPKVADYLDMAPKLQGTANAKADASFDLRLVHYTIGGDINSANPYWDIVAPAVSTRENRRVVDGGQSNGSPRLAYAAMFLQSVYAYAIPSPETLAWVSDFCDGRPLVELGAGRGYWAGQLANSGLTVEAYDSEPPDQEENASFPKAAGQHDVWHTVSTIRSPGEVLSDRASSVLFLCWPPGWGSSMAADSLAAFEKAGGDRLIFIGEPRGGMTATDSFFDSLSSRWRLESEDDQFVRWWNVADVAQGWVRN